MLTPQQMLEQRTRHLTLDIYGRRDRSRVADQVARVYALPCRPLRVVAVEPLTGGRRIRAFYSTRHEADAEQVLSLGLKGRGSKNIMKTLFNAVQQAA